MKIQNAKIKEVPVISVCVRKKLTLLTDTVTAVFKSRRGGFTLIEIIMIIVVVSIAIPALLILIGGEAGRGVEPELRITATNVAQQLMDEIMTKCWDEDVVSVSGTCTDPMTIYSDLGIDSGEDTTPPYDTSTYDDVDDYASGVDAVTVGEISYSRSVQVCYVPDTALNSIPCVILGSTGTNYKRIAVTVTRGSTSVVLTTVMTNY